jgi:hypothetical protein
MSVDKQIMYGCHCDNCGEHWIDEEKGIAVFGTENDVLNEVRNFESWHTEGPFGNEKHYCPECFTINDNDELVIDMTRTKPLDWEIKSQVATGMPASTSLDGCPFHYCDKSPKCEGTCRYAECQTKC